MNTNVSNKNSKKFISNIRSNNSNINSSNRRKNNAAKNSSKPKNKNNSGCNGGISKRTNSNRMVEKTTNAMRNAYIEHPFLKCRFSCCTMSCSIPDGSGGQHIPLPLYAIDFVTTSASTLFLQFNPWIPSPILLHAPGAAPIVNGTAVVGSSNNTDANGSSYYPLGCPSSMRLGFVPNGRNIAENFINQTADIYNASAVRIAGIRFKITNTTAKMFRSGQYITFPNNMSLNDCNYLTNVASAPAAGQTALNMRRINATTSFFAQTGAPFLFSDGDLQVTAPTGGVKTETMDNPIYIYLQKASKEFRAVPYSTKNLGVVGGSNFSNLVTTTTAPINMMMCQADTGQAACVNAYDNDFAGTGLIMTGLSTTQANSFTIETFITLEVRPAANSGYTPLLKNSPKPNMAVMNQAIKLQTQLPNTGVIDPRK